MSHIMAANLGVSRRLLSMSLGRVAARGCNFMNNSNLQTHTSQFARSSSTETSKRFISITSRRSHDTQSGKSHESRSILVSKPAGKHVAHVELNQPKTKNAFSLEAGSELVSLLDELEEDASIRCVVMSGVGAHFCSGVDLRSFMTGYARLAELQDPAKKAGLLRKLIEQFQAPFKRLHTFRKPLVCCLHGVSYGLAMELAACSDIRFCSGDARLAIREVLIGIAADVGSLQLMPKLVSNQSLLRELIFTGRDIEPREALDFGFVSRLLEDKQATVSAALETAELISRRSPVAVQGSKANLAFSEGKPFLVGLDYNAIWNMSMMQSGDVPKAITSIFERQSDSTDYEDF